MFHSATLSRYIGRQFVSWFALLLLVMLFIILMLDTVELLRRAANRPNVSLSLVLRMSLLKLPGVGQQVFPFVVMFSAMFTFWRLTRSHELVVARAAGVSAWQFLAPVLIASVAIAAIQVTVINPIGSVLLARFQHLEDKYLRGRTSSLDVSPSGLWLRQIDGDDQYLIHADAVVPGTSDLRQVIVFQYHGADNYIGRIDAASAALLEGRWELREGWLNRPNRPPEQVPLHSIPTDLTMKKIQESFARPETMSFWELPRFIRTMEATGFSAIRHRLHYQALLSQPLLFSAMVLFAAAFSLRQTRRGGTLLMIAGGIMTGFVVFVSTDVVLTLGVSESIPVMMAAWLPAGISLLLGIAVLLHLEDG